MTISIDLSIFSVSAVLTAVKKQQVHADWNLTERQDKQALLTFSTVRTENMTAEQCADAFVRQLTDEQIREKLESDFRGVRELLVNTALAPIAKA